MAVCTKNDINNKLNSTTAINKGKQMQRYTKRDYVRVPSKGMEGIYLREVWVSS